MEGLSRKRERVFFTKRKGATAFLAHSTSRSGAFRRRDAFKERKAHGTEFPNMRKRKASRIAREEETNKTDSLLKPIATERDSRFPLSSVCLRESITKANPTHRGVIFEASIGNLRYSLYERDDNVRFAWNFIPRYGSRKIIQITIQVYNVVI